MKYILEPYKYNNRYKCPNCGKEKEFVRYIDTDTGKYLADFVGRCNREVKCGYHYKPSDYFRDYPERLKSINENTHKQKVNYVNQINIKKNNFIFDTIPLETVKASLKGYENNNFVQFLLSRYSKEAVQNAVNSYLIGTSNKWQGSCIFWQIDKEKKVRTGKIMLYGLNGKRVKEPYNYISWVHTQFNNFKLNQCLYGLHLVSMDKMNKAVIIVESEKTAIIASIHFDKYLWLACGGLSNLTADKLEPIKNRKILLCPDLGAVEKWKNKAIELAKEGFKVGIFELEIYANEYAINNGLDLADFL